MTEELITATNKDGSVPGADRLLAPGPDKAGDLGKAALLPAPDGMPLLEAGASRDERKSSLRRIGRGVVDLAYRLMKRTRLTKNGNFGLTWMALTAILFPRVILISQGALRAVIMKK